MTTTSTKERPIIFSGESVRSILEGRKTQTRRVIKWKAREKGLNLGFSALEAGAYANDDPRTGWVLRSRDGRGTWNDRTYPLKCRYGLAGDRLWVRETWADCGGYYRYPATDDVNSLRVLRSPREMRRIASRISLDVVAVRVERLQKITAADVFAEGVGAFEQSHLDVAREMFARGWNALNEKRGFGWEKNPWVWVVEFRRIER